METEPVGGVWAWVEAGPRLALRNFKATSQRCRLGHHGNVEAGGAKKTDEVKGPTDTRTQVIFQPHV